MRLISPKSYFILHKFDQIIYLAHGGRISNWRKS